MIYKKWANRDTVFCLRVCCFHLHDPQLIGSTSENPLLLCLFSVVKGKRDVVRGCMCNCFNQFTRATIRWFCVNFLPSDSSRRIRRTGEWDVFLGAPEKEWRSVSEWVKWAWAIIISEYVNCVINYGEECRQWIRNTTQQQMDYFWPSTTTTRRRRSSGGRRKTYRVKKRKFTTFNSMKWKLQGKRINDFHLQVAYLSRRRKMRRRRTEKVHRNTNWKLCLISLGIFYNYQWIIESGFLLPFQW